MHFLFIKIIDIDYKDDIFMALESVGISKASYTDAYNLDSVLSNELPLFKGFFKTDADKAKEEIIITAIIEDQKQAKDLIEILDEAGLDIRNNEILRLMTWKLDMFFEAGRK